jgi:hypothetical protein
MTCREVQEWLMEANGVRPAPVARHLVACAACRSLAARLDALHSDWRAVPLPPGVEEAKQAFLKCRIPPPLPTMARFELRRWLPVYAAAAALVLVTVGLTSWLFLNGRPDSGPSAAGVVEDLLAWNLDLAKASTPDERAKLFHERQAEMQAALRTKDLPPESRKLAELLAENGSALAADADPVAAAERFGDVADELLDRLAAAAEQGDLATAEKVAGLYGKVADQGVAANLGRAEEAPPGDPELKKKLGAAANRQRQRAKQLEAVLERAPPAVRKELRKKLEAAAKAGKPKGRRGGR